MPPDKFNRVREYYELNRCWEFKWSQFEKWCKKNKIDADEWFDEYRAKANRGEITIPE